MSPASETVSGRLKWFVRSATTKLKIWACEAGERRRRGERGRKRQNKGTDLAPEQSIRGYTVVDPLSGLEPINGHVVHATKRATIVVHKHERGGGADTIQL